MSEYLTEHGRKLTEEKIQQFKEDLKDSIKGDAESRMLFNLEQSEEKAFEELVHGLAKEGFDTSVLGDIYEDRETVEEYLPTGTLEVHWSDEVEVLKKPGATLEKFYDKE